MKMKEKTVSFNVSDTTGSSTARLTVLADSTIGQARPQILESLELSNSDFNGQPVTWTLYRSAPDEQALSDDDRIGDVLNEGQTVVPMKNITAGGYPK